MVKTLLKKQLEELISNILNGGYNGKKKRGKLKSLFYVLLILYVFAIFAWIFYMFSEMLFEAFSPAEIEWLAFSIIGIAALGIGVIGTVFLSNSVLYKAKDNDLLLSMPIKPWQIIFARICTLYIMNIFYESVALLPCFAAYIALRNASFSVILGNIAVFLALPLLSLGISLVLGFIVALVSGGGKNNAIITVIISVAFISLYFYVISEINNYIAMIVTNGAMIAQNIKKFIYPIYAMGRACTGNIFGVLVFLGFVISIFAIIYCVVSKSFLRLATFKRGEKRAVYREKSYAPKSVVEALLRKELAHFKSSPTYVLNCAIGSIFILIAAVFVLLKGEELAKALLVLNGARELIPLVACAVVFAMASMNMITAPSISLEGKRLWILRSLPVSSWEVLKSKVVLHMLLSGVPSFIFAVVCVFVFPMDAAAMTIIPMMAIISNLMFAFMGLAINLKHPMFDWINEAVPVKQGFSVILSMLMGTGIIIFFVIVYIVLYLNVKIPLLGTLYMLCVMLVCIAMTVALYLWLRKRGTKIFDSF